MNIRSINLEDIYHVTEWAREEGFAPGIGDVNIYRNTDRQGLWIATLVGKPIGCIAGVRYNNDYGFLGLYIVKKEFRGNGYGIQLWKHVINKLEDLKCIGLEAAPNRVEDYSRWGFRFSSTTTRWFFNSTEESNLITAESVPTIQGTKLLEGSQISKEIIQSYDATREDTPRPHFLSDWLFNDNGTVLTLVNSEGYCLGFGRIRPCLLQSGTGHRIGPLLADNPIIAINLLQNLLQRYSGTVLIDSPGLNREASNVFETIGFKKISKTARMYKGSQPSISLDQVYGLACLELG